MGKLDGRRILITGAASGIGTATAQLFHDEGACLALIDRDEAGLASLATKLKAVAATLDLERSDDVAGGVEKAIAALRPIEATDLPLLSRVLAINLTGPYLVCQAAAPHLRRCQGSTIVNIASAQALLPNISNTTAYAASKGGVIAFSKALAAELAPAVRVNLVCPGLVNTPMNAQHLAGYASPAEAPWVQSYALKRMAEAEEVARAILFLTSADSSFITGAALPVDGGRTYH
jgi:NAD(P)-dependent dehydrogenase (short-subunit alcohol dehydrogenase family)